MKLLMENWRQFVNEQEEEVPMDKFLDAEYTQFVKWLGSNIQDPKTQALIGAGLQDGDPDEDKFSFNEGAIAVSQLQPTQNEIDIDKSLAFPLIKTKGEGFIKNVSSDGPFTVGSPIITFMGKYIVDGHHRWSQLYACNKNATITAIDVSIEGIDPLDALKAVQMAIGLKAKQIPVQSVQGTNLLKVSGGDLTGWIKKNVPPQTYEAILSDPAVKNMLVKVRNQDIEEANQMEMAAIQAGLIRYIGGNIAAMKQTSQPVSGAGPRDFMPQTGGIDWETPLKQGEVDIKPPHARLKKAAQE
jgi:hypothetical protein